MTTRKFSDISFTFDTHPSTSDVIRLYDDASIKQSVKSLVLTNFYERPFQPSIGSGLLGLLFENDTELTRLALVNAIHEVITNHEPRVEVDIQDINLEVLDNTYNVNIAMDVVGLDKTIDTTLTLTRIR